jgi:quercetin dioxygenase-like cupin family protein
MVTTSHARLLPLIGTVALIVLLAGCGGGSAGTEASSSGSGAAAPTAGAAGVEPLLQAQQLTVLDQQVAYPKKKPAQVTSSILTLEPGQETGWHKQKVPTYAYVLEGTLTVEYDAGVTKEYSAGTALLEAVGVWSNGTNKGDAPARILVVYMGAEGVKNSVQRTP